MSEVPLEEQSREISETEINCQVYLDLSNFPISTERLKQLKVETLNEKTLKRVASYTAKRLTKIAKSDKTRIKALLKFFNNSIIIEII